jgi:hypothetical protein
MLMILPRRPDRKAPEGLAQEEDRFEVEIQHRIPIGFGKVQGLGAADDPGIVDHGIQRPLFRPELRDEPRPRHRRGEIHRHGHEPPLRRRRSEGGGGLVHAAAPGGEDLGPRLPQRQGDAAPDADIGPGHEDALARQRKGPAHRRSSAGWRRTSV